MAFLLGVGGSDFACSVVCMMMDFWLMFWGGEVCCGLEDVRLFCFVINLEESLCISRILRV